MATSWNSQQANGKYFLQFETDDKEKYKLVEKAAQMAIDGKTAADVVPKSEVAKEILADFRKMIKGYENIDVYLDRIEKKYTEGTNEN